MDFRIVCHEYRFIILSVKLNCYVLRVGIIEITVVNTSGVNVTSRSKSKNLARIWQDHHKNEKGSMNFSS